MTTRDGQEQTTSAGTAAPRIYTRARYCASPDCRAISCKDTPGYGEPTTANPFV